MGCDLRNLNFIKIPEIFNYRKSYWAVSGVYCIKSKLNSKIYIGSSINIYKRVSDHFYKLRKNKHHNQYLQNSFFKYGADDFYFDVLEKCSVEYLIEREQFFIDIFRSADRRFGYNIDPTANRSVVAEETKRKISEIQKGRVSNRLGAKLSEFTKEKIRLVNLGKHIPEETRKKISASLRGVNTWAAGSIKGPRSLSVKEKISLKNKGSGNGMAKTVVFMRGNIVENLWGSGVEAAKFHEIKDYTLRAYIKKQKMYNGGYFKYEK